MALTVCPAAEVNASIEKVWGLLIDPKLYSTWADAVVQRVEPEGKAHAGQVVHLWSKSMGLKWKVTMKINEVDHHNHRFSLETHLPFGFKLINFITCTPVSENRTYVRYG